MENPKSEYPYRVVTTYYKRGELETPHRDVQHAIDLIRLIIEWRKVSSLCTVKLLKGDRCIWRKSFGT